MIYRLRSRLQGFIEQAASFSSNQQRIYKMPLILLPCEEADLPDFQRIQLAAFAASGMTKLIKPSPVTDDYVQTGINKHLKSFREERDVHYLKVIDTELGGKMIAGAKWRINEKSRTEEDVRKTLPVPGKTEEERPALRDFMNYLARVRWEYMGTKPFYCESCGMVVERCDC